MKKIKSTIISAASVLALLLIIFSCQIGIWNLLVPVSLAHQHHRVAQSAAKCCQTENNSAPVATDNADGGIFTLPTDRPLFASVFFYVLLASFILLQKTGNRVSDNYSKVIREKYGGFKLFCYFSRLFRSGIIHPKVY